MSEQDAADEVIRANADYYNVILHIPQHNSRVYFSDPDLATAVEYAETCYDDEWVAQPRAAMIHAVTEQGRFALMGTTNRFNRKFKPVQVKIY